MIPVTISGHALEQYRSRVIHCPERERPKAVLRRAMLQQIEALPWRLAGGETFAVEAGPLRPRRRFPFDLVVDHVTHTFLVERGVVVTVLGFMMRTSRKHNRRKRHVRKVRRAYRQKLAAAAEAAR